MTLTNEYNALRQIKPLDDFENGQYLESWNRLRDAKMKKRLKIELSVRLVKVNIQGSENEK